MQITDLEPQVNNAERVNVYVDGRFLLGVNAVIVLRMGLRVGQEVLPEQLEQLRNEEAEQQAVDRALNYLSFRPRSREEVRRYLQRKETPPYVIDAALERLNRLNFVNDRAFVEFWVENREKFKPRGARALKNELRLKGVERDIVDELVDKDGDEELALRAAHKKAASLAHTPGMDYATFRNRLSAFLQRRGFGYEAVKHTVKALWNEMKQEDTERE